MKLAAALMLAATTAGAIDVPSGQPLELYEVLVDDLGAETWIRFRFIAPEIARETGTITYEQAEPDMAALCQTLAIPYIAEYELDGQVVVISMSDRATEFGVPDPEATQFFEAYRLQNGVCVWEGV